MIRAAAPAALLLAASVVLAGCHYYRVEDPRSGQVFYADRWVAADGYTGPLEFTDASGRHISLRQTRVTRIDRQDFLESTAADGGTAATKPQ